MTGLKLSFLFLAVALCTQAQPGAVQPDYNILLRDLADQEMTSIFGEGFRAHFTMTCLQNPCEPGYFYANTFYTQKPCTTEPQHTCKEAIVTYAYAQEDVPLTITMLVTMKDEISYVQLGSGQFDNVQVPEWQQDILSTREINAVFDEYYKADSLQLISYNSPLAYCREPIRDPVPNPYDKFGGDPGYRVVKRTHAGRNWRNGFVYVAHTTDPNKAPRVFTFDALTGELLWVTELYAVPN